MAWHSSGVGNGGGPGGNGEGNGGQPLGTEYTLQGVMRFLQSEWHRHERDRNSWDIERAEMKSRIGKLEGDGRTAKRLHGTLEKHVKMLETTLKKERQHFKTSLAEKSEGSQSDTNSAKGEVKGDAQANSPKPEKPAHESEAEDAANAEMKQDLERDKSRLYLGKCVQEVTYHVVPATVAQQALAEEQEQQALQNHRYPNHMSQQSMEELYAQQHRQKQQPNHVPAPQIPNHQPPPVPRNADASALARSHQSDQGPFLGRGHPENHILSQAGPIAAIDSRHPSRQTYGFPPVPEDHVERVTHSFDAYGRQIPPQEETTVHVNQEQSANEVGQWDFDVEPDQLQRDGSQDLTQQQRQELHAQQASLRSSPHGPGSRRRNSASKRRPSDDSHELRELSLSQTSSGGPGASSTFKVRFALRGHLDVVRSVIFTGGGTPAEPEICTTGDDGVIKRWIIPASYSALGGAGGHGDLDIASYFTHRGHASAVTCLASAPASPNFLNGGRALGDGWVFSGGQDTTVRVWERGRVDPKATLDGHSDAVWSVCVLPASSAAVLGDQAPGGGRAEQRLLLASGAADGTVCVWTVSSPPQLTSPQTGSRRGAGGSRRANSISSGSNFPSSPQPSTATAIPFHYTLVHRISRIGSPSPTCIVPLATAGDNFVVAYSDASVVIYDTKTKEEVIGMASQETYDGTTATGVNAIAATTSGLDGTDSSSHRSGGDEEVHSATGSSAVEGMVLSGHEDRFIRFFDANSGQCTYTMLAHPSAISALSLSPDGRELVSAGHDASLRFWSLEKRSCTQEIASHRPMRGEGVCAVQWSADGRWVVSGGGDGVVKVWTR